MVQPLTSASPETTVSSQPLLEFDRIGLEYPFEESVRTIIQEISLSVEPGEFVTFVGPSGCGKTSILRMVSGLSPTKIGELRCHGQPVVKPLKNVGIAFQNPVLLPWRRTIDNVLLPLEIVSPYKRDFKVNRDRLKGFSEAIPLAIVRWDASESFTLSGVDSST